MVSFRASEVVGLELEGDDRQRAIAFQDITELAELRAQREQLVQLATIGELTPKLLHDLRNPLAAIAATAELLEDGGDSPPASARGIAGAVREIELVLDALHAMRHDLPGREPISVGDALADVFSVIAQRAGHRNITAELVLGTLPRLRLSRAGVRALAYHLTQNAVEACRGSGRIVLSAHMVDGAVSITVSDNGVGMDEHVLACCQTPFFTTKRTGSGLGLAVVSRMVRNAGGSLTFDSAVGRGTTVRVRLPVPGDSELRASA